MKYTSGFLARITQANIVLSNYFYYCYYLVSQDLSSQHCLVKLLLLLLLSSKPGLIKPTLSCQTLLSSFILPLCMFCIICILIVCMCVYTGCFSKDQVYLDGILRILRHRRNINFKRLTALGKAGPIHTNVFFFIESIHLIMNIHINLCIS